MRSYCIGRRMSLAEARLCGLRPLTLAVTAEDPFLRRVMADLERGGVLYGTVRTPEGEEVWRTKEGYLGEVLAGGRVQEEEV